MNGSRPFTAVERETLTFLREKAAEWLRAYGRETFAKDGQLDPTQIGKALGAAQSVFEALIETVPEARS